MYYIYGEFVAQHDTFTVLPIEIGIKHYRSSDKEEFHRALSFIPGQK